MDVRASDAEREQTIEHLRTAAADGRLTFEELADRIDAASSAVMRSDLVPLTADLPAPHGLLPTGPSQLRITGTIKRSGPWVVAPELKLHSLFGSVKLDLRDATLTSQEVHIDARSPFGNIELVVPEGVEVEVQANGKLKQDNVSVT